MAAPDDFMTRRGIGATADIAAHASDEANGGTQSLRGG